MYGIFVKLALSLSSFLLVYSLEQDKSSLDEITHSVPPLSFRLKSMMMLLLLLNEAAGTLIFSSLMAFFSKISDPTIGGSAMTLLNTTANLSSKWPGILSLWLIPKLTFQHCEIVTNHSTIRVEASCSSSSG
jgi:PAT family acetyl-CoA transporter-like MFS transporter 1